MITRMPHRGYPFLVCLFLYGGASTRIWGSGLEIGVCGGVSALMWLRSFAWVRSGSSGGPLLPINRVDVMVLSISSRYPAFPGKHIMSCMRKVTCSSDGFWLSIDDFALSIAVLPFNCYALPVYILFSRLQAGAMAFYQRFLLFYQRI